MNILDEESETDRSDADLLLSSADQNALQSRRCLVLGRKSGLVKKILSSLGLHCTEGRVSWRVLWSPRGVPLDLYKQLAAHQIVNRLPGSQTLTRKDALVVNIRRMVKRHGSIHFGSIIPKTFLLPTETDALHDAMIAKPDALWIIKPTAGSQGTDIRVIRSKKKVLFKHCAIVSRYIDPFLIEGLKFDLRLYVVVTCIRPLRIYWHEEGLVRFATEPYTPDVNQLTNRFIHLTNVAINRRHPKYDDINENGHKRRLSKLWEHLGPDRSETVKHAIETLIVKTIISGHNTILTAVHQYVPHKREGQLFELFGFDVLLDRKLRPWLLEVNRSPTLTGSSKLDTEVKAAMLFDLFALVGVTSGSRPSSATPTKKSIVSDTDAEYNRRGKWIRLYPRYEPVARLALSQFFEERQMRVMASLLSNRVPATPGRRHLYEIQKGKHSHSIFSERSDVKLLNQLRDRFGMHYPLIRSCKTER